MPTTLDLLQEAALVLAQQGSVKDRLAEAWSRFLSQLDPGVVPENHRAEFRALADALRREPPLPREDPARASVRKMSMEEASRHAALVVRLYGAVARTGAAGTNVSRAVPVAPVLQLVAGEA